MPDLPGTSTVIDAYLKGRALKQQRDYQQGQIESERQQNEYRLKQLEQNWKVSEQKFNELSAFQRAQLTKQQADHDLKIKEFRIKLASGIQAGLVEPDPDNPGEFRDTPKGTAIKTEADKAGLIETAKNPALIERAGGIAKAQAEGTLPTDLIKMGTHFDYVFNQQKKAQEFTGQQNELNRNLRRDLAGERLAESRAKRENDQQANDEYLEAHLDSIAHGDLTKEQISQIPLKERSKLLGEKDKRKLTLLDSKNTTKLSEGADLDRFIKLNESLYGLIKGKNPIESATNPEVTALRGEIDALAKTFAVNVAGDRSILSEKEVPRIREGLVQINPSGWTVADPRNWNKITEVNDAANLRRLQEFKTVRKARLREILGNAPVSQWKALNNKYNLGLANVEDIEPPPSNRDKLK